MDLTLEEVHARHYRKLVGYACKKLREAGVPESFIGAEDVVQNAFAKAYRDPARIEQPQSYLFQIMRREILEHARQGRHYAQWEVDVCPDVDDVSDVVTSRWDVHHALAGLPAQQRSAVWATKGLRFSQAEYAEAVGRKPGTVATHVARAMVTLKTVLAVTSILAAVLLCSLGSATVRRYSPSHGGQPQPDLVPDLPQPAVYAMWAAAAVYCCALLVLAVLILVPKVRALTKMDPSLRVRLRLRSEARQEDPDDARAYSLGYKPDFSRTRKPCWHCGKVTRHEYLRGAELEWFRQKANAKWAPSICPDCRTVLYVLDDLGLKVSVRVPVMTED
ncbi:RNA polymerase sigma factor [Streptomyces sp. NPDC093675]|uniref:RNA polymerase sigma factor n=1 Tax=Streptomyces sp. NPDC093675 TaxID=3366049 RepID=UPI0037F79008